MDDRLGDGAGPATHRDRSRGRRCPARLERPGPGRCPRVHSAAARLQAPIPAGLAGELDGLLGRLDPAGEHALLHGDPCPGNEIHTGEGMRFFDLEGAALGNGYTELAYLWAGFPTCWCATSVPEPVRHEAAAAYRATWRSLTGTDPRGRLADSCETGGDPILVSGLDVR